jgi:hypothetical protein
MKGGKRFKQRSTSKEVNTVPDLDFKNLKYDEAMKEFRRMTNTTHYA